MHCSLQYLLEQTDAAKELLPLMEVKLELQTPEMVFNPTLDQESPDGFFMLMEGVIEDVFRVSTLVPRVARHSGQEDYGVCMCGYIGSTYLLYVVVRMYCCVLVCVRYSVQLSDTGGCGGDCRAV